MSRKPNSIARAGVILSALIFIGIMASRRQAAAPTPPSNSAAPPGPVIRLLHDGGRDVFAVGRFGPAPISKISPTDLPAATWAAIFSVTANNNSQPMLGYYSLEQGTLFFRPRWPLVPGVVYAATFHPNKLPGRSGLGDDTVIATFMAPKPVLPPAASLAAIYPSAEKLPENLLRLYLQFNGPMRRGDVYDFIRLLGPDGKPVETPFVTFGEELWSADGTRLTLLLDPGRQKHDLLPRQQAGPVLEAGNQYTLVISGDWPDAYGRPLGQEVRKQFTALAADPRPVQPADWKLTPPSAGSRDPLIVTFDRSLDHELLQRTLTVTDPAGKTIDGELKVIYHETGWQFVPQQAWPAGDYSLMVEPILEDVSGNRVGRAFEVDEDRTEAQPPQAAIRPFTVRGK
jgi:hypothetical protein